MRYRSHFERMYRMNEPLRKIAVWVGCSLISIAIALAMIAGWGHFAYGSARAFPAIVRGQHFIAEPSVINAGALRPGTRQQVEIELTSLSSQAIAIIGMRSNCTCVQADEFPFELPSGDRRKFRLWVRPLEKQAGTTFSQSIDLYPGTPGPPVVVTVKGTVSKQSAAQ